jgi:hypothetical protein
MGLFDNLFGRKKQEVKPASPLPFVRATLPPIKNQPNSSEKPSITDPAKDPKMVRVYDAYGREMFITKENWRTNVLPGSIKTNWDDAEKLFNIIVGSLNDGFFSDILPAAKHLHEIDPNPARPVGCVAGVARAGDVRRAWPLCRGKIAANHRFSEGVHTFCSYSSVNVLTTASGLKLLPS